MWLAETGVELLALLLLGGYLWRKQCERIGCKYEPRERRDWKGSGFDGSPLRPRLEQVRREHSSALGSRRPDTTFKPKLLTVARNLVSGLAYFRDRSSPETEHDCAAEQHT